MRVVRDPSVQTFYSVLALQAGRSELLNDRCRGCEGEDMPCLLVSHFNTH